MRITQKHIQYILLLLIVVIAFCAYQFGYVGFIEKANKVKTENKAIEARISDLNDKETHRDEWTEGINSVDGKIKEVLAKYGPGNTPEKSIMFVDKLEEAADMEVSSIAFNPDTPIFTSGDLDENGNPKVEMNQSSISINYSTTYDGLKACMDLINNYKERMNVSGFAVSPNSETGKLVGNMVINLFSVKDADHVYEEPVITDINIGSDNIFGWGFVNGPTDNTTIDDVSEPIANDTENTGEGEGEGTDENAGAGD